MPVEKKGSAFRGAKPKRGTGPQKADGRPHYGGDHCGADRVFNSVHSVSSGDSAGRQLLRRNRVYIGNISADSGYAVFFAGHYEYAEGGLSGGHSLRAGGTAVCLCGSVCEGGKDSGGPVSGGVHAAGGIAALCAVPVHDYALWQVRPDYPVSAGDL